MAGWANFYVLTGTGAATLMGLMFIAITFGAKLVTHETAGMAKWILSPIINHFAHVFILSSVALMPGVGVLPLASVAIALSVLRLLLLPGVAASLKKASRTSSSIELSDWIYGVLIPLVLYLDLGLSGLAACGEYAWGLYGIAIGVVGLLILGTASAWDMLLWMALQVGTRE